MYEELFVTIIVNSLYLLGDIDLKYYYDNSTSAETSPIFYESEF